MKNLFKLATLTTALALSANLANAADKIGFADPVYLLQNHPTMVETAQKIEKLGQDAKAKFAAEEKKLQEQDKALNEEAKVIEADMQKLQKEHETVEASLKKKVAALDKEAPKLRAKEIEARRNAMIAEQNAFQNKVAALQKREAAFQQKAAEFQKSVNEYQQKIDQAQKSHGLDLPAIEKKAVEDVNAAIKKTAEAKGYTVVLLPSGALYAKDEKEANITEAVLAELKATVKPEMPAAAPQAK